MQKIGVSICLCFLPLFISAQSIERNVIAAAGDEAGSPALSLSYTVGETVIKTFEQPTLQLNQGFQQSKFELIMPAGDAIVHLEAKAYPNPAVSELHLQFQSEHMSQWSMNVFDQNGQCMHREKFQLIGKQSKVLDCSTWLPGMYYLLLNEMEGGIKTIKIEKLE